MEMAKKAHLTPEVQFHKDTGDPGCEANIEEVKEQCACTRSLQGVRYCFNKTRQKNYI